MKKYKVYRLIDQNSEIKYIGQTRTQLYRRLSAHKVRFSDRTFTMELIDSFDSPEPMYLLEAELIKKYDLVNKGWNKAFGFSKTPEQFSQTGSNNGFFGHKHRQEICEKIGKRSIGNKYAKGSKSRRGQKNGEFWRKVISEAKSKRVLCLDTGIEYKSCREAANTLKLNETKISAVCRGVRNTTGKLRFKYL